MTCTVVGLCFDLQNLCRCSLNLKASNKINVVFQWCKTCPSFLRRRPEYSQGLTVVVFGGGGEQGLLDPSELPLHFRQLNMVHCENCPFPAKTSFPALLHVFILILLPAGEDEDGEDLGPWTRVESLKPAGDIWVDAEAATAQPSWEVPHGETGESAEDKDASSTELYAAGEVWEEMIVYKKSIIKPSDINQVGVGSRQGNSPVK